MRQEHGQSPDEIFDIVDDNDTVIGSMPRSEIHRRQLKHRAIHIFWLSSDGKLALQRRSYAKDNSPGLLSSSCAGHVDSGETYITAAIRELNEELGVEVSSDQLSEIDYAPSHPHLGQEFVKSYLLQGDFAFNLHRPEVDTIAWRTPTELRHWVEAQPELFATAFIHLLARPNITKALGLG
jgi:16S rRNA (adenine1518-N6/adenine1519-N6)-dimethyltransferase